MAGAALICVKQLSPEFLNRLISVNANQHQPPHLSLELCESQFKEVEMQIKSMLPTLWGDSTTSKEPFRALQTEIDRLFSDFTADFPSVANWNGNGRLMPRLDVAETETALEVMAELPGVEEKDIDITISDDMLRIKAEKKSDKEEKTKDYHLVERSYGTFERSMRLPFKADSSKANAKFEKGVLKLTLQKPAEAKSKVQKIEVKAAA
jgi:HSP20 family protein